MRAASDGWYGTCAGPVSSWRDQEEEAPMSWEIVAVAVVAAVVAAYAFGRQRRPPHQPKRADEIRNEEIRPH